MKNLGYRVAHRLLRWYWFLCRPKTKGVRCLIRHTDKFLLIRHAYGSDVWTLPGGGVRRKESLEDAVRRELYEEVGLRIQDPLYIGSYTSDAEYKQDTVHCFHADVPNVDIQVTSPEVVQAEWFTEIDLPSPRATVVDRCLALLKQSVC